MTEAALVRIGDLERQVLDYLWSDTSGKRWFTVREVHEALTRDRDMAYTTVMTVLQRLARKRMVLEARDNRAYLYRPTVSRAVLACGLMKEALDGLAASDRQIALQEFVSSATSADLETWRSALARQATT